jgi:acyl-CoA reductase-like NAD-dependent aldehyde dehydrogenase
MGGAEKINFAVAAGEKAFFTWSGLRPSDRALPLNRFAD